MTTLEGQELMDSDQRLEQRIKTLEYEVKILKNEIQRALLDIQEQVLSHYYPQLRSSVESLDDTALQAFNAVQEKKKSLGDAPKPAPDPASAPAGGAAGGVILDDDDDNGDADVAVQQVSLKDQLAEKPANVGTALQMSNTEVVAFSNWVNGTVAKIGQERTSRIVETAADRSWLKVDVADLLRKLVAMGDGGSAPETVAINEILRAAIDLNKMAGRSGNVDEALTLIDEAKLG